MKKAGRHRKGKTGRGVYAVGALGLAGLIIAAFFAPGLAFGIQDSFRCSGYAFEVQESQDIMLLGADYEQSLYQRLKKYAETVAAGEQIYVNMQELEPNDELDSFLKEEQGEATYLLVDTGLFPYSMIYDSEVRAWKQYVLYSDDYTQGVNFILWYIELENREGTLFKLLVDAKSGELYAVKSDDAVRRSRVKGVYAQYTLEDMGFSIHSSGGRAELWTGLAYYFGGNLYQSEEMREVYNGIDTDTLSDGIDQHVLFSQDERGEAVDFTFPYGETSLNFRLEVRDGFWTTKQYSTMIADVTVGFPAIYEKIPEFLE